MVWRRACVAATWILLVGHASAQQPFPRPTPNAGAVLSAKGGEELRFPADVDWRHVVAQQALNGGDTLRTNAFGTLAILFADETQIRVGRNSTLQVKSIASSPSGDTVLSLRQGAIFGRATRGGSTVTVETPAAASGVRGTDWSLSVDGAKTSLAVMEGSVTLSNALGTITVNQGEGGEAIVGQAPRKVVLANFDGREQLLLYRELRDFFYFVPTADIDRKAQREARARALVVPAERRSADDLLTLAEAALIHDGTRAAASHLDAAERMRLDGPRKARAQLLRGYVAARDGDWPRAEKLLSAAMPRLDASRRAAAAYALWTARAAGRPAQAPGKRPENAGGGVAGAFARAQTEGFAENALRGADLLAEDLKRRPGNALLHAARAMMLITAGRADEAREEAETAVRLDPDEPLALAMRARYRRTVTSDLASARADLLHAIEIAPGNQNLWMELGLVERARKAPREAERAFLKAIELNPDNPLILASYGVFLVGRNRLPEADAVLQRAEALDPTGLYPLAVRGRALIAQGRFEQARGKLLAASAVNPSYADAQTMLAIAGYQLGDRDAAEQALDIAERYDDDEYGVPLIRSIIARDQFRADEAVTAAREAVRRSLARGGDYATLETDRNNGSPVNDAMRFVGLNDWGRFYGDRIFNPFRASSYFDVGVASRPSILSALSGGVADQDIGRGRASTSATLQGLLLDPLSVSAPRRRLNIFHSAFAEASVGGTASFADGATGWSSSFGVQSKTMGAIPVAVSIEGARSRPDSGIANDRDRLTRGSAYLGLQPTPADNLVLYGTYSKAATDFRFVDPISFEPDRERYVLGTFGAGWSHEFGYRNILQAAVTGAARRTRERGDLVPDVNGDGVDDIDFFYDRRVRSLTRTGGVAVSHLVGIGDVSLRYGVEGGLLSDTPTEQRSYPLFGFEESLPSRTKGRSGVVYADAIWDVTSSLKLEGGVFFGKLNYRFRDETCSVLDEPCAGGRFRTSDDFRDGRIGVAWRPFENHWLRAAWRRDTSLLTQTTLAPLATIGILPNEVPAPAGSPVETVAFRWDAEWSPHLFTSLDYQRQSAETIFTAIPETLDTTSEYGARIRRLTASANLWLTHGFGLSGRYVRSWSETEDGRSKRLAYLPQDAGRIALTFVSPLRVRLQVAQNLVGDRRSSTGERLRSFATTDASISWTSPDRSLVLGLQGLNLFDRRYVVQDQDRFAEPPPFMQGGDILGQSRTIVASAELRF